MIGCCSVVSLRAGDERFLMRPGSIYGSICIRADTSWPKDAHSLFPPASSVCDLALLAFILGRTSSLFLRVRGRSVSWRFFLLCLLRLIAFSGPTPPPFPGPVARFYPCASPCTFGKQPCSFSFAERRCYTSLVSELSRARGTLSAAALVVEFFFKFFLVFSCPARDFASCFM